MTTLAPAAAEIPVPSRERATEVWIERLTKRFPVRRSWLETFAHPFRRERQVVLHDVSLEVRSGEFFGLLGPNGAGKTTLFKILSTLILPDHGTVRVAGLDVTRNEAEVRRLLTPVVADERSLFWRISARENLRAYAALQGLRGAALRERVEELLEVVELADTGDKMVAKFSSGMKQRLILARALLARPRILLLDEPTRSLDPLSARRFRSFLRDEIAGKQGCTVLLATHNAEEALELCTRIGVLDRGRLLRVGTPGQLLDEMGDERYRVLVHPADWAAFVAVAATGTCGRPVGEPDEGTGWIAAQVEIRGGIERTSEVNAELVRRGVRIGRLEPIRLSLAELIERVVARQPGEGEPHV